MPIEFKSIKFLLLLICLISFQYAFSQGQPKDKCEILKEVLEGDSIVARKLFILYSRQDIPIIIVDTSRFFRECNITKLGKRPVRILHDPTGIDKETDHVISVYVLTKDHRQYYVHFYAERTHGICSVELRRTKDKFYLIKKKCGVID